MRFDTEDIGEISNRMSPDGECEARLSNRGGLPAGQHIRGYIQDERQRSDPGLIFVL